MKKKILAVMLCGVLSAAMLTGCGSKSDSENADTTTEDSTNEDVEDEDAEDEEVDDTEDAEDAGEDVSEETGDEEASEGEGLAIQGTYAATMLMTDEEHAMTIADYTAQSGDETFAMFDGATLTFVDAENVVCTTADGTETEGVYSFDGTTLQIDTGDGNPDSYTYDADNNYFTYAIESDSSTMYVVFSA